MSCIVLQKQQPHIAYQSIYLFFFSPMKISVTYFSAPIGAIFFQILVRLQVGTVYYVN